MGMWKCLSCLFFYVQVNYFPHKSDANTEDFNKESICVYVNKSCIYWSIGYYCSGGSVSSMPSDGVTGDICPVEHYCPLGSTSPVVCPDGTYTNTTGIDNSFHGSASHNKYHDFKYKMQTLIHYFFFSFFFFKWRGRSMWWLPHRDLLSVRRRCPALSSRTLLSWWWCWGYSTLPYWHIQPSVWPQPSGAVPHLSSRWEYCHLVVFIALQDTGKSFMKCSVSWTGFWHIKWCIF